MHISHPPGNHLSDPSLSHTPSFASLFPVDHELLTLGVTFTFSRAALHLNPASDFLHCIPSDTLLLSKVAFYTSKYSSRSSEIDRRLSSIHRAGRSSPGTFLYPVLTTTTCCHRQITATMHQEVMHPLPIATYMDQDTALHILHSSFILQCTRNP